MHPPSNSLTDFQNAIGIKYITIIRHGLSNLREHKLKTSFQDLTNPIDCWGNDVRFVVHFFLHYPHIAINDAHS